MTRTKLKTQPAAQQVEISISSLTRLYRISGKCGEWKTFGGAVRAATRRGYEVMTTEDPMLTYIKNEKKTKIVTNLISGKLVRIPVNTPLCCDPSSETYWSS
jgi:hypothetical protein